FLLHDVQEHELTEIADEGLPGAFIVESLRFCCGLPATVASQATIAGNPVFSERWNNDECFRRLGWLATAAREGALSDSDWKNDVKAILNEMLRRGSENLLPAAIALLSVGGDLSDEQAGRVFEEYARKHELSHPVLGRLLINWPALLAVERSEKVLESSRQ